ncbi:MAG: CidA/LrgA family protein [Burkholderiaceae bacterium]
MLNGLTLILVCQLIGELISQATGGPIPGPVIGMVILFLFLLVRGSVPKNLQTTGNALLSNFSLLFIPAGVGVMLHFRLLGRDWLAVSVALIVSTILTIVVTALLMSRLNKTKANAELATTVADDE